MLRRLAISLAATSALVLTAAAPALADHAQPDLELDGNVKSCEGLDLDFEYEVEWEKSTENADGVIDHSWFTAKVSDTEPTRLDLEVLVPPSERDPELALVVLVKGGNATNVFVEPNFDDLFAPTVNEKGEHAGVSNFTVCKVAVSEDDDGDHGDDGNGGGDGDGGNDGDGGDDGKGGGDRDKTPAAVPTAVPAGVSGSDGGSMAPVGIAAAVLAMLAGGAALLRRHFAHLS